MSKKVTLDMVANVDYHAKDAHLFHVKVVDIEHYEPNLNTLFSIISPQASQSMLDDEDNNQPLLWEEAHLLGT